MCAKRLCAATALASLLTIAVAAPAMAWPFGGKSDKPAAAAKAEPSKATTAKGAATAPAAAPAPHKADPVQRAAADRLDPLAAAAFWAREVQLDPTDIEAELKLSVVLRQIGRTEEAAQAAQRVIVMAPGNIDGLLELARARIAEGQGFYAIESLKQAQALKPRDWRPATLLGIALEQSQRPDEAKAAHDLALSLDPNNPAVLSNAALFKAGQGDRAGAETLLRKAVAQPNATARERQNLALLLGLQGKMAEAEKLMRQDLPPPIADANLAYLKTSGAPAPQARR
jgi:Flp pilus assembly protein TadD